MGHAGIFFAKKKNGGLWLIVDGRIGNCILAPPPKVHLPSSGTFAELRVDSADPFFLSALDVENAFHNYEIPEWLSELYGLNAVTAGEMDIASLDGCPLSPEDQIYSLYEVASYGMFVGRGMMPGLAHGAAAG